MPELDATTFASWACSSCPFMIAKPLAQCVDEDLELAVQCDRLGFDEFWVGEHHTSEVENIVMPEIFIAKAVAMTERIRFGPAPVCLQSIIRSTWRTGWRFSITSRTAGSTSALDRGLSRPTWRFTAFVRRTWRPVWRIGRADSGNLDARSAFYASRNLLEREPREAPRSGNGTGRAAQTAPEAVPADRRSQYQPPIGRHREGRRPRLFTLQPSHDFRRRAHAAMGDPAAKLAMPCPHLLGSVGLARP